MKCQYQGLSSRHTCMYLYFSAGGKESQHVRIQRFLGFITTCSRKIHSLGHLKHRLNIFLNFCLLKAKLQKEADIYFTFHSICLSGLQDWEIFYLQEALVNQENLDCLGIHALP